ncbi:hypothetical protein NADFUDRAFT_82836 [Nadsonia fulvescens var. elongata DSM 6958]|uniref:ATPase inhibitor, mitochondrial n=1 Tax=Nadsonia fulvescens var. elongata DSM 6958 TaxID=857566 RepID=A0A1E3PKF4_9ASCO|nr:hypothetical protein NADFUDRAFT_82836 [Nadsonia fulvescens var. elongata DSM 6958]
MAPTSAQTIRALRRPALPTWLPIRKYTEGATGAPRSGSSSDAFTQRERSMEELYMRKHDAEKMAMLREALHLQQKRMDTLEEKV